MTDTKKDRPTKADIDRFVSTCIAKGWTVRAITHPKSRANWARQEVTNVSQM